MSILRSKRFHSFLGVAVSVGILIWISFQLDWDKVGAELKRVNYWLFIPATFIFALHIALRSIRWRFLLPPSDRPMPFMALFDSLMLGNLATFIFPLRAGEFVRPFLLSRKTGTPFATNFVSVIIERFFDLSAVLISFGILIAYLPGMRPEVYQGAAALSLMAAMILILIAIGAFFPKFIFKMLGIFTGFLPSKVAAGITGFAENFLKGAAVLRNPTRLFQVVLFTVLVWITNYLIYYIFIALVNVEPTILFAVAVSVILALAVAAPSMPGFIGVYQIATIWGFEMFGVSKEVATTCAIVTHLYQYLVFGLYGAIAMARGNLSVGDLRKPVREEG